MYQEIQKNEQLKESFVTALKENTVEDFLKANDCEGTVEDVMKFMNSKREGELCDDDMEKVAGGACTTRSCKCPYSQYCTNMGRCE